MADEQNISDNWFIGEDKILPITVYRDAAHSATQDITGWTLSWMLKRRSSDADASALLTKTTTTGGTVLTTPLSGLCTVTIADTDTDALNPGSYHHELKRTDAGFETVLTHGTVLLKRALHRT
jgi:hypothetical protein